MKIEQFLKELEELEQKATKGKWKLEYPDEPEEFGDIQTLLPEEEIRNIVVTDCNVYPPERNDADFIIKSRTAIPTLIKLVREYREALEKMGCNETFHRLGGIDDCERCKALSLTLEDLE